MTGLNLLFTNNTGFTDDAVFVTFQNPQHEATDKKFNVTYGKQVAVPFASPDNMMSTSLSLQEIGSGGFTVNEVDGVVIYISYGKALASTTTAPVFIGSGTDYDTPFQPFELTRMGNSGDQGDLTAINFFTATQSIKSYSGGVNGTLQQSTGYTQTSAEIGDSIEAICPGCQVLNNSGNIVRYIGPSSYPPPGGKPAQPWPSFVDYLQSINQAGQSTTIQNHNAFNVGGKNYNFTLNLTATIGDDSSIQMDGNITTIATKGGQEPTFNNASITIPSTQPDTLDYIIYGQVNNTSIVWGPGWTALQTFVDKLGCPGAYGITQSLAIGEITTGLLLGMLNSPVTQNGIAIKNMASEDWWRLNPMIAFSGAQPNNSYYNQYANLIYNGSNNQAYSIPYSDRLGDGPLVNSVQYNGDIIDTWVVGLDPPVTPS